VSYGWATRSFAEEDLNQEPWSKERIAKIPGDILAISVPFTDRWKSWVCAMVCGKEPKFARWPPPGEFQGLSKPPRIGGS
jgi:hypothetical protein